MRVTRIHAPGPLAEGARITLGAHAARHVLRVLRLGTGAPLVLFDGAGAEYDAIIAATGTGGVAVAVGAPRPARAESPLEVTLVQGIARSERMDWIVQKATELGVAHIRPVACAFSVVRLRDEQAAARLKHWQGVALSACEQCGRARLPTVGAPRALTALLASLEAAAPDEARLVLDPVGLTTLATLPARLRGVTVLIGPEGGLAPAELELAAGRGFAGLKLGPRILRTETAALTALAALQARYGDLGA